MCILVDSTPTQSYTCKQQYRNMCLGLIINEFPSISYDFLPPPRDPPRPPRPSSLLFLLLPSSSLFFPLLPTSAFFFLILPYSSFFVLLLPCSFFFFRLPGRRRKMKEVVRRSKNKEEGRRRKKEEGRRKKEEGRRGSGRVCVQRFAFCMFYY